MEPSKPHPHERDRDGSTEHVSMHEPFVLYIHFLLTYQFTQYITLYIY